MKPRIRELSRDELIQIGIENATMYVAEYEGRQVGSVVLGSLGGQPFASDLASLPEFPEVAAMLIQKVRKVSKSLGHARTSFSIDPANLTLMKLVESGNATIDMLILSVKS